MKIGIDLSPLQTSNRQRGIGYSLLNFINHLPTSKPTKHSFVFYLDSTKEETVFDTLKLLHLEGLNYEIRYMPYIDKLLHHRHDLSWFSRLHQTFVQYRQWIQRHLPPQWQRYLNFVSNYFRARVNIWLGDSLLRHADTYDIDIFLQFDPTKHLLPTKRLKCALILYDVIPYVLDWDYLWSYHTTRKLGYKRSDAIHHALQHWLYIYKLRINVRRATILIAISKKTKQDFIMYAHAPSNKIIVTPLGAPDPSQLLTIHAQSAHLNHYVQTAWGYMRRPIKLNTAFILFVGGADNRRKLQDLITAFNLIRAQGYSLKLVLVGDSMQGVDNISTTKTRQALQLSSYLNDIIFMGFVDDSQRDWLYSHALAFIFPSRYEGFGLPVLEAMIHRCPVISYNNEATNEVAGDNIKYADSSITLCNTIIDLMKMSPKAKRVMIDKGFNHAKTYNWPTTSELILNCITK